MTPCGHLACEPLHALIKKRFEHTGGVKISAKGVVSSAARLKRRSGSRSGSRVARDSVLHDCSWWWAGGAQACARAGLPMERALKRRHPDGVSGIVAQLLERSGGTPAGGGVHLSGTGGP